MKNKSDNKTFFKRLLFIAALVLFILHFSNIMQVLQNIWAIISPLFLGFIIAYIVNILMKFFEKIYFPNSKKGWLNKSRKLVCLILAFSTILLLIALVVNLILPQIIETFVKLARIFPAYFEQIQNWLEKYQEQWPSVAEWLKGFDLDWQNISSSIFSYATLGVSGILSSSINIIATVTSKIFNLVVALTFSIYLLSGKDRLIKQLKKMQSIFIKERTAHRLNTALSVANESFSSFIVGQCTEALVLGSLCVLGMWIFQFPYAISIGVFMGVTSLIPVFGAYLGAIVGVLLILPVDPIKAVLFIVFIIVLQQLETNLIYPKVVGTSIGLPGIWVFVAVILGGGISGIIGMLFSVPLAATIYKLLRILSDKKQKEKKAVPAQSSSTN